MEHLEVTIKQVLLSATGPSAPPKLAAALDYALFPGGARVRPQILLAVARACGIDNPGLSLASAAALELMHCASLVHDDLPAFDDADLRRGKPSVHRAFGEPVAVLVGDTLIVQAFEAVCDARYDASGRQLALARRLARYTGAPHGICAGQGWESEITVDVGLYHAAKTGALFMAAAEMGALSAGGDPDAWTEMGARIGAAYQVADDLRDALLGEAELGKPAGQDARHGRPSSVEEYGVQGSVTLLQDSLGAAISSIPACPGEAELAMLVRAQADRLVPEGLRART
ncbi:MAG: polyprenyl synthetase family protein [Pseudomonadota bacterium]